jgi:myosin heavy subunit
LGATVLSQEEAVANLILPFSSLSKDRKISFTKEMEMAAIFYLAESDRKKGEGILLKKPIEELLLISECSYPIWLAPWKGQTLLFDGLGVSKHTLAYEFLPDVKNFMNDIEGSVEKLEAYTAALSDHIHYFQSTLRSEERTILGLIASTDFVKDFSTHLTNAEPFQAEGKEAVCLTPIVDESTITQALNELQELRTLLEKEIESLRSSMRLLNNTTRSHVETLKNEIHQTQKEFNEKIETAKAEAMEKIRGIQKGYDDRITKASKRFEQQLQNLHQEKVKLEKNQDKAQLQIDRCENEIRTAKMNKNSALEQRWKQEMENWKREAKTLQKSVEQNDRKIEETESDKKVEITNLRSEFNTQSETTMKPVRELEASRDAKTQMTQQKIKSLEDLTQTLVDQQDNLAKQKRASLNELEKLGMRDNRRKTVLAYVPLYLACFQTDATRRYVVYPPSIAGTMGVLTKFKGIFGASRVKSLFQQRSQAETTILNQLVTVIERDPVFKRDLHDTAVQSSILRSKETRERIQHGLTELRREEWISENELQTLNTSLVET